MDFDPWWLILVPVLFGLGWIAARVDVRQMLSETRKLPDSYFRGLNFLLNEEPDRAIDAFIEVARLDPETTELHFALGSLFRRRGEMERAIRVHQSLLSRADLPEAEREHALHELGQDFLKAGLLDRAEQAFEQLLDTRFAVPAVKALIRIYESEHDWIRAIDAVKRLRALVDEPVPQLAHYQCERAHAALTARPPQPDQADEALDAAEHAVQSLRAHGGDTEGAEARIAMLRALQARLREDNGLERTYLGSVLRNAPTYASLIASGLLESWRKAGDPERGLQLLQEHYASHPSLDVFSVLFRELREARGRQVAWDFARDALSRHPSLLGLDRVLDVEIGKAQAASAPLDGTDMPPLTGGADFGLLRSLIHRHTQRLDRYSCKVCGFEAKTYYWQCPGCNSWETYTPRRVEELR